MNRLFQLMILVISFLPIVCISQESSLNSFSNSLNLPPENIEVKTKKFRFEVPRGIREFAGPMKFRTVKVKYKYSLTYDSFDSVFAFGENILKLKYDTVLIDSLTHMGLIALEQERIEIDGTMLFSICDFTIHNIKIDNNTLQCTSFFNNGQVIYAFDELYFIVTPHTQMHIKFFCINILGMPDSTGFELIQKGGFYQRQFVGIPNLE